MPIYGSLETMDLGDILQWIYLRGKTGQLTVKINNYEKKFFLRKGKLKYGISEEPNERLGPYLMKTLDISKQELIMAITLGKRDKLSLPQAMETLGIASRETVERALEELVREIAFNSFVDEGYFRFEEREMEVPYEVDIDIQDILLSGYARKDELLEIQKVIPHLGVKFEILKKKKGEPLLELLARGMTLGEAAEELGLSPFEAFKKAYDLYESGHLKPLGVEKREDEKEKSDRFILLREKAEMFYREGRLKEALDLYQKLLKEDPGNQFLMARIEEIKKAHSVELEDRWVPKLKISMEKVISADLSPQEGFVLSRINGAWTLAEIIKLCPFPEETTRGILKILLAKGIIEI